MKGTLLNKKSFGNNGWIWFDGSTSVLALLCVYILCAIVHISYVSIFYVHISYLSIFYVHISFVFLDY